VVVIDDSMSIEMGRSRRLVVGQIYTLGALKKRR
jgi:hypothetical protein